MGRAKDIYDKVIKERERAIDEFILTRKSEELFLDFKRSADNGAGRTLNQADRENLAKAISGFGNSEGGVIVWGIHCSKDRMDAADVASARKPIQDVKRFASWLEGAVSGCTVPPHIGVQNHCISMSDRDEGFVATYIPKSVHAPHQTVGKLQYYIRAGSSFVPAPHGVLSGMFGRRPQPEVFHMFTYFPAELVGYTNIHTEMGFMIVNRGPGIATDLFMNARILSKPGENCVMAFKPLDQSNWVGQFSFGVELALISKVEVRLAPEAKLQPFVLDTVFAPPFSQNLKIDCVCGCGQSPSIKFQMNTQKEIIETTYHDFLEKEKKGLLKERDKYDIVKELFNLEKEGSPLQKTKE